MPPDGKYAPGLRGFPTPNDVTPDGGYVVFRLPKDNEWAGLILGAVQVLAQSWNWYQWGDMTPDEASEAFRLIVTQAPYDLCGCAQPGGGRILRLGAGGVIQELTDENEWDEPSGDYTVPPVPGRTEPTAYERRCAAAANAANVLMLLYEEVSDLVAAHATSAEILAALVAAAAIQIGAWLGLALAALVGLAYALFIAFVEIAEFITADLWTTEFNDAFKCILLRCAVADGDVVTFDYDCVREGMAAGVEILDPEVLNNIRLFGQIDFMLNVIGVDGLNAAGATTGITDADCDDCDGWTVCWLGGAGLGDWITPTTIPGDARSAGLYDGGTDSIGSTSINPFGDEWANFQLDEALTITGINIDFDYVNDPDSGGVNFWADGEIAAIDEPLESGSGSTSWAFVPTEASAVTSLQFRFAALGHVTITRIKIDGIGTHPASGEDCV